MASAFTSVEDSSVLLWSGKPDCDAAHSDVLAFLNGHCTPFPTSVKAGDNILRGNLGETIVFCLGRSERFGSKCLGHFANALRPFSGKSNPELDLLWVHFGQSAKDDWAVLQEVKTTAATSIDYATNLISDYDKLFGTNPRLTLQTRIQDFKNRLEFEQNQPADIVQRANQLIGASPVACPRIRLLPTVVHDSAATDVVDTMLLVRESLTGKNWADVEPWAVGLSSLDARLVRLARGKA